ncbi:MAG TPA: efflux transporter outer membrane subunit [Phycisphaerae bacterium]|nr:efflux transporter outer membrane subunit [Phycisphaerae bacterium]
MKGGMDGMKGLTATGVRRGTVRKRLGAGVLTALAGAAAALLPACKVSPDYKRPPLEVPGGYKSATTMESSTEPGFGQDWWVVFGDAELNGLEERAVYGNQNVKAAMARVAQARAALTVTRSQFYPVVTADPSVTRSRSAAGRSGSGATATNIRIPFDVSYEVDIWGRISRSVEAGKAQVKEFEAAFAVVLQTLEADVASDYFSLRSLDRQSAILTREIDEYRQQENLIQQKVDAEIANSKLDLAQVQSVLETTITQEADLRRQRADFEHAIAVLLGVPPAEFSLPVREQRLAAPAIPAGLPVDLLYRRPDVAEAEQTLIAANANVGVAMANFYPVVTLTGAGGFESFDLQHVANWQSTFWSLGPDVSIPLFTGGRLTGQLRQAKAQYDEILADYRQAVLTAFQDVEDNLSDLHLRAESAAAADRAVTASRQYRELSDVEYRQGIIDALTLIDADRTLQQAEITQAQIEAARLTSTVLLIKSLGGAWNQADPTRMPVPFPGAATLPAGTMPAIGEAMTAPASAPALGR